MVEGTSGCDWEGRDWTGSDFGSLVADAVCVSPLTQKRGGCPTSSTSATPPPNSVLLAALMSEKQWEVVLHLRYTQNSRMQPHSRHCDQDYRMHSSHMQLDHQEPEVLMCLHMLIMAGYGCARPRLPPAGLSICTEATAPSYSRTSLTASLSYQRVSAPTTAETEHEPLGPNMYCTVPALQPQLIATDDHRGTREHALDGLHKMDCEQNRVKYAQSSILSPLQVCIVSFHRLSSCGLITFSLSYRWR